VPDKDCGRLKILSFFLHDILYLIMMFASRQLLSFFLIYFSLYIQFSLAAKVNDSPGEEDFCKKYAEFRKMEGYLSYKDVRDYCNRNCQTLPKYACSVNDSSGFPEISFDLMGRLGKLFDKKDLLDDAWMTEVMDADSVMESVWFFAPWMYALCYVIVASGQADLRRSRIPVLLVNGVALAIYFAIFLGAGLWPLAFNIILALQSSFASSSHSIFNDVAAVGILIVSVVVGTLMVRDLIAQLFLGVLLLACFLVLFYRKATQSRKEDLFNTLSLLLTLKMCADYIQLIFDRLMIDNPGTLFVRHFIYAMFPWEGKYASFLNNMFHSSAQLATLFIKGDDDSSNHLYVFLLGLLSYGFVFVGLRCCLGIVVLKKLHADISFQLIWTGFYSYSIDVLNPFKVVYISLCNRDSRMLWYAIIMCIFNIGEFFTAREFLLMRSLLMAIDYLIVDSGLAGAYRFLDYEVDLSGLVFEKPGAFPYFFIDNLVEVQKNCKTIHVVEKDNGGNVVGNSSGVGLIRHSMSGPRLFTVRHVLDMKDHVRTEDNLVSESVGSLITLGDSVDPPVSMYMPGCQANGSEVRDIGPNEMKSIKYLFVISPSGAIAPVSDWSLHDGDIHASVNVKPGDSGSPVCAVLSDGICVLAGAVSRGNPDEGCRNLISAIHTRKRLAGSPGMVAPYHETDGHFLSQNSYNMMIEKAQKLREGFGLYYDEFPELFPELDFQRQKGDEPPWDGTGREENENRRDAGKRRVKNWKKNRAAGKRQFVETLDLLDYDDRSKAAMIKFADGGGIVRFNILRRKPRRRA
jgi:hypothetical protein